MVSGRPRRLGKVDRCFLPDGVALDYAAGDAATGARVRTVGVGLLVDDDGGAVRVEERMVGVQRQRHGSGEYIGAGRTVGRGVDVRRVTGVDPAFIQEAMPGTAGVEVSAGGCEAR